jgi:hypothetical protein
MNRGRFYHAVEEGLFPPVPTRYRSEILSLPKVDSNSPPFDPEPFGRFAYATLNHAKIGSIPSLFTLGPVKLIFKNLPGKLHLQKVGALKKTFRRSRNLRKGQRRKSRRMQLIGTHGLFQRAIEYIQQTDPPLLRSNCNTPGGEVGATLSTSERQSKYTQGRPVSVPRYSSRIISASIFPMRPALTATGRPGLGVKSTLYMVLGRPYQTKIQAQIQIPGNGHDGF